MPVNLKSALRWSVATQDERAMLSELQGNILKGHGREHTANLFLRFDKQNVEAVKAWIKDLASTKVTNALEQLEDAQKHREAKENDGVHDAGTFCAFFLTARGYQVLGVAAKSPQDPAFLAGMASRRSTLNDPDRSEWEEGFQAEIHALLLLGDDDLKRLKSGVDTTTGSLPASITVLLVESGKAYRNANGDGVEHFGYVDGRSQPLMLKEDVDRERLETDGVSVWDPEFPIGQALVPDPGGDISSFGSYFVFRKLEQNVAAFDKCEGELAAALGISEDLAGAQMVGRFEDGTPISVQKAPGAHHPVMNNFNFVDDTEGTKCPFHAHIRKTNPRGESPAPVEEEREHIMARRGITYGERQLNESGDEFIDKPSGGVGLLFMAYQNDISKQFEFTQRLWANNRNFVKPGTGLDPLVGQAAQGDPGFKLSHIPKWGGARDDSAAVEFDFGGFVKMLGGEYFFAPSLTALRGL